MPHAEWAALNVSLAETLFFMADHGPAFVATQVQSYERQTC
jgi:hypothetical protein